uniref:Uncharacterized protein n=1 Tax=Oryza rufipogon TaxID=4529 RepID=A0A0E0P2L6_ORYRU
MRHVTFFAAVLVAIFLTSGGGRMSSTAARPTAVGGAGAPPAAGGRGRHWRPSLQSISEHLRQQRRRPVPSHSRRWPLARAVHVAAIKSLKVKSRIKDQDITIHKAEPMERFSWAMGFFGPYGAGGRGDGDSRAREAMANGSDASWEPKATAGT